MELAEDAPMEGPVVTATDGAPRATRTEDAAAGEPGGAARDVAGLQPHAGPGPAEPLLEPTLEAQRGDIADAAAGAEPEEERDAAGAPLDARPAAAQVRDVADTSVGDAAGGQGVLPLRPVPPSVPADAGAGGFRRAQYHGRVQAAEAPETGAGRPLSAGAHGERSAMQQALPARPQSAADRPAEEAAGHAGGRPNLDAAEEDA